MKNTAWMAIVAVMLAGGTACNRNPQSGPEAALERAYKAGVFSKEEYDAKRAAMRMSPTPAATPAPAAAVAAPLTPAPAPAAPSPAPADVAPIAPAPAPAKVAAVRAIRPKPAAIPTAAPVQPAPPAPAPVARQVARQVARPVVERTPVPPPPPVSVDRDDDPPAPTSACGAAEIRPGKEKGKVQRFYPIPVAKVRDAAIKALQTLEFHIQRATDTELEAGKKRHIGLIGSGGEKMTMRFEEAVQDGRRGTRVIGETKKGFIMRAGQKSWTNAVLDQTACVLNAGGRDSLRAGN